MTAFISRLKRVFLATAEIDSAEVSGLPDATIGVAFAIGFKISRLGIGCQWRIDFSQFGCNTRNTIRQRTASIVYGKGSTPNDQGRDPDHEECRKLSPRPLMTLIAAFKTA